MIVRLKSWEVEVYFGADWFSLGPLEWVLKMGLCTL
jgi:hypothetical protein